MFDLESSHLDEDSSATGQSTAGPALETNRRASTSLNSSIYGIWIGHRCWGIRRRESTLSEGICGGEVGEKSNVGGEVGVHETMAMK